MAAMAMNGQPSRAMDIRAHIGGDSARLVLPLLEAPPSVLEPVLDCEQRETQRVARLNRSKESWIVSSGDRQHLRRDVERARNALCDRRASRRGEGKLDARLASVVGKRIEHKRNRVVVGSAFDAVEEAFGLPGVLVNNAAANFPVPTEDMSPNAWRTVVDITLNGTFLCSREFGRRHGGGSRRARTATRASRDVPSRQRDAPPVRHR